MEIIETNKTPYITMMNMKLEEGEKPLGRVVGHTRQKRELINIVNWFNNSEELKKKGISIPHGVILYGRPGNGKSLMMKEVMRCVNAPCFVFRGESNEIPEDIEKTFKKAKEAGKAVVIIDELDLLIDKDNRTTRVLQDNLDGVESGEDILVIAATNFIGDIPEPLKRPGRLERIIKIPYPTGKEAFELLLTHFKNMKVTTEELDETELETTLEYISCASIKSIANDVVLRNGFDNITREMIIESISNVEDRVCDEANTHYYNTAVHEAGHAVMANAFKDFFVLSRLSLVSTGGYMSCQEKQKDLWTYDKVIADIKISYAGIIAEKIVCGSGSRGCEEDLQNARRDAYNAINMIGYSACWKTLPEVKLYNNYREESNDKKRKNEKEIEKLLRRCEKQTTKYLKKHKTEITAIADKLYEKKFLRSQEALNIIEGVN